MEHPFNRREFLQKTTGLYVSGLLPMGGDLLPESVFTPDGYEQALIDSWQEHFHTFFLAVKTYPDWIHTFAVTQTYHDWLEAKVNPAYAMLRSPIEHAMRDNGFAQQNMPITKETWHRLFEVVDAAAELAEPGVELCRERIKKVGIEEKYKDILEEQEQTHNLIAAILQAVIAHKTPQE